MSLFQNRRKRVMDKTKRDIDLGLSVLTAISKDGKVWSHRDIALVCGCSKSYIQLIEQQSLKKLRIKLKYGKHKHILTENDLECFIQNY